jgi:ABC-2 type transport system ATP-binding protein
MIELENATKLYGAVIGVNDVTLSLPRGSFGLIGPNGSGKSTLLNLVAGQFRPTLGAVRVLGMRPWNNAQVGRRIGVCPEQQALYGNVTGFEWVRYLVELQGCSVGEASARARQSLELVGLQEAMHRRMGGYSRGMRQRAKLAQALAHDPELLVLDEPFNGLDPVGRRHMTEVLKARVRAGKGLLLASHLLHEVEAITECFLFICNGRLLASGAADEVHSLLADLPDEIRIRASDPRRLAERLVGQQTIDAVRFGKNPDELLVATHSPATLYRQLPAWSQEAGVEIYEVRSGDGSLQTLFDSLLQIHRGMAHDHR